MKYERASDTCIHSSDTYTNTCLLGGVHLSLSSVSHMYCRSSKYHCLLDKPMITLCIVWSCPTVVCGVRVR